MLIKEKLFEGMEEKYIPMLKEVNIPDFTKCIAQFAGLEIEKVSDDSIKNYLQTWARNKFKFYEMLGNKLRYDTVIKYKEENKDSVNCFEEISLNFPIYALWLDSFKFSRANKIERRELDYNTKQIIQRVIPNFNIDCGCSITHFFKKYLKAPDELITAIGKIWENEEITGNYTVSIDPVDMMLASENPYNWRSCYRLETQQDSHADGCLAAILDDSSLITYVWTSEGKYSLYDNFNFKSIRYKKMREWISISPSFTKIHFNDIYPGKTYSKEFQKILREVCENLVNKNAIWNFNDGEHYWHTDCSRANFYGYGEFSCEKIWTIKDSGNEEWETYNEKIICPCGCGEYLPGSDEDDDGEYNGDGFLAENFEERYYCELIDDYCEDYDGDCSECLTFKRNNAVCELDNDEHCDRVEEAEDEGNFNVSNSDLTVYCGNHCEGCPLYELHHSQEERDE